MPQFTIKNPYKCTLSADSVPIYDVFAARLDGRFEIAGESLSLRPVVKSLRGTYICVLGPHYAQQAMLSVVGRFDGAQEVQPLFLADPSWSTMVMLFPVPEEPSSLHQVQFSVFFGQQQYFQTSVPLPRNGGHGLLAVATLAKYDWPYIAEWVDYHHAIGVEHFYIYNNNEPRIRRALAGHDSIVTHIDWPHPYVVYPAAWAPWQPNDSHRYCQPPQQTHALRKYGPGWEWMALIDVDEFLHPHAGTHLASLLGQYAQNDPCVLEVKSRGFGTSCHAEVPSGSVLDNYTCCERGYGNSPKVIVRPQQVQSAFVHVAYTRGAVCSLPTDVLTLNHYRAISDHYSRRGPLYDREGTNETKDTHILEVRDANA